MKKYAIFDCELRGGISEKIVSRIEPEMKRQTTRIYGGKESS